MSHTFQNLRYFILISHFLRTWQPRDIKALSCLASQELLCTLIRQMLLPEGAVVSGVNCLWLPCFSFTGADVSASSTALSFHLRFIPCKRSFLLCSYSNVLLCCVFPGGGAALAKLTSCTRQNDRVRAMPASCYFNE